MKILLTPTPAFRRQYYGERSLKGLQGLGQVKLHEGHDALDAAGLVEAADEVDIIVADRVTEGRGEIFRKLPKLRAFVRCAVDIRNIDVAAASSAGVLVTRASPGFVQSVAELALGFMVDLSRGVSRATADYHAAPLLDVQGTNLGKIIPKNAIKDLPLFISGGLKGQPGFRGPDPRSDWGLQQSPHWRRVAGWPE